MGLQSSARLFLPFYSFFFFSFLPFGYTLYIIFLPFFESLARYEYNALDIENNEMLHGRNITITTSLFFFFSSFWVYIIYNILTIFRESG